MRLKQFSIVSILFIAVLLLPAGAVTPATAQTPSQSPCLQGLTQADCTLLTAAGDNTKPLTTFELGYDMSMTIGLSIGGGTFKLKGTGPVDLTGITATDIQSVVDNLIFSSVANLTVTGQNNGNLNDLTLLMKDGVLYIKNPAPRGSKGSVNAVAWYKINTSKLISKNNATGDLSSAKMLLQPTQIIALLNLPQQITGERKAGPVVEGKATRLYNMVLDFGKVYTTVPKSQQDEFLQTFLTGFLRFTQTKKVPDITKDPQLRQAVERLIRATRLTFGWIIEPVGKTVKGIGFSLVTQFDATVGKLLSPAYAKGKSSLNFNLAVTFSKAGQAVSVDVPSKAFDLTDMLQQNLPEMNTDPAA